MQNTSVSSSFTIRCNGSLSFSYNDSCNSCLNDRFYRHPLANSSSQCTSCCICCSTCCCRNVVINSGKGCLIYPSYFGGIKQSSLIHWVPHKRLILNGLDRFYGSRFPGFDVGGGCYGEHYKGKVSRRRWRSGEGRFGGVANEEESGRQRLWGGGGGFDEAEVMLSLLTEDVREECFGVEERKGKAFRKFRVDGGGNGKGDKIRSWKKKVKNGDKVEGISEFELETVAVRSREGNMRREDNGKREEEREVLLGREVRKARLKEGERDNQLREISSGRLREEEREHLLRKNQKVEERKEERKEESEELSRHENHFQKVRKGGSSCSSYYSLSSGGFESDEEIQVEEDQFENELRRDSGRDSKGSLDAKREYKSYEDYSKKSGLVLSKDDRHEQVSAASVGVESGWRKESEKKLTDVYVEESEASKDSAQRKSRYLEDQESSYEMVSSSHSKFDDYKKEKASLVVNAKTKEEHRQTVESGTSTKHKHFQDTSSSSQKLYNSRKENLSQAATSAQDVRKHHMPTGQIRREEASKRSYLKIDEEGKMEEMNSRRTSEIRKKNLDDHLSKDKHNTKEQHESFQAKRLVESRLKHDKLIDSSNSENLSVSETEITRRSRKQEVKSSYVHNSQIESTELQLDTNSKHIRAVPNTKRSQESIISVPLYSDNNIAIAPSSQLEASGSLHVKSPGGVVIEEINVERSTDSYSLDEHQTQTLQLEEVNVAKKDEIAQQPVKLISEAGDLGSADRLQKSSAHHVGEFLQQVKYQISGSEIHEVKETFKENLESEDERHNQATLILHGSGSSESKERDSRHSSRSSRGKVSFDEMWNVNELSVEDPSKEEALVSEGTSQNGAVKRTGKSLWNIIADIVRFRWALHHDKHGASSKSGRKSSPNQSTSSDTWFSGHDPQESIDYNGQKDMISLSQGSVLVEQPKKKKLASSRRELSSSSSSRGEGKHQRDSASTSAVVTPKTSSPKAVLLPASGSTPSMSLEATTSGAEGSQLTISPPSSHIGHAPVVDQTLSAGGAEALASSSAGQTYQPVGTDSPDDSSPDGRDREAKQRKLQRNDQVVKDRFDEWEEAYMIGSEQQKIDEMFMREALLEAKKAADIWEVPVGAVLVQGGKIIARGYNLVEELRDSTAHAEMICIKEASNVLRTWRLSETTLYVTLEPCPMCAGAILQARIDTVVWGAPNKLLGADGSWIRLFPSAEGGSGLEPSDKPAAPVHPFHPKIVIRRGILASECASAMQQFFQRRRKREKKQEPAPPPSCLPISHHPSKFLTKMHEAFNIMFCM